MSIQLIQQYYSKLEPAKCYGGSWNKLSLRRVFALSDETILCYIAVSSREKIASRRLATQNFLYGISGRKSAAGVACGGSCYLIEMYSSME